MYLENDQYYKIGHKITDNPETTYLLGIEGHGWGANLPVKQWNLALENAQAKSSGSHAFYEHVLWRFELLDSDRCLIINKNSGLYLGIPENAKIGDGAILVEPLSAMNPNPHEVIKSHPPKNIIWRMDKTNGSGKIAFYNDRVAPNPLTIGVKRNDIMKNTAQIVIIDKPTTENRDLVFFSIVKDGTQFGKSFVPPYNQENGDRVPDYQIALTLTSQIASVSGSDLVPLVDAFSTVLNLFNNEADPYKLLYDKIMLGVERLLTADSIREYYAALNGAALKIKEIYNYAGTFSPIVIRGNVQNAIEKLKTEGNDSFVYIIYGVSIWITIADYCYKNPVPESCFSVNERPNLSEEQMITNLRSSLKDLLSHYIDYVLLQVESIWEERRDGIVLKKESKSRGGFSGTDYWWQIHDPKKHGTKEDFVKQLYPIERDSINKWNTFYVSEAIGKDDYSERGPAFEANYGYPKLNLDNWRKILKNWQQISPD